MDEPYYRRDLARVHHEGFDFHAEAVAPGILRILEPVRASGGLVVEFGCGSGLLTRHLVAAGHRVLATNLVRGRAMLDLARETAQGAVAFEVLALPRDPVPPADAIVGVGHPINYLPSLDAIHQALGAMAAALRPRGSYRVGRLRPRVRRRSAGDRPSRGWVPRRLDIAHPGSPLPTPDRFVRQMAMFSRNPDGTYQKDDERHDNVLLDVTTIPPLLLAHGVEATISTAFGEETMPEGLHTVVGRKAGSAPAQPTRPSHGAPLLDADYSPGHRCSPSVHCAVPKGMLPRPAARSPVAGRFDRRSARPASDPAAQPLQ